jgi:hypothetical protein
MKLNSKNATDLAEQFFRDGAVLINRIVNKQDLKELKAHIGFYVREVVPFLPDFAIRWEPDNSSFRSLYFMEKFDPYFEKFGEREDIKQIVRKVTGWEPELHYVETFNKPAKVGTEITPHQEIAFIPLDPPEMVHVWIAIDRATDENGAIDYWLGTHKYGLLPHRERARFGGQLTLEARLIESFNAPQERALLPAGGAAIHHGLLIHASQPNRTGSDRCGLVIAYRGSQTQFA